MGVLCCREASVCLEMGKTSGSQSGFVLQPDEDPKHPSLPGEELLPEDQSEE